MLPGQAQTQNLSRMRRAATGLTQGLPFDTCYMPVTFDLICREQDTATATTLLNSERLRLPCTQACLQQSWSSLPMPKRSRQVFEIKVGNVGFGPLQQEEVHWVAAGAHGSSGGATTGAYLPRHHPQPHRQKLCLQTGCRPDSSQRHCGGRLLLEPLGGRALWCYPIVL